MAKQGIETPEFTRCTYERWWEMLEVLPPLAWVSKGFLVSEPWSHRECKVTGAYRATYRAMVGSDAGNPCFESTAGLTVPEWKALNPATLRIEIEIESKE